ncbi:hypothetical protein ASC97_30925 [Rhizobium sp. Root1203]|nr:hypothetical protein ASC97_30925 [Rhizobium sp. Root1203]
MTVGPVPILLSIVGGVLYFRLIARRENIEGQSILAALFVSTFLCAAVFALFLKANAFTVFLAQCVGSAVFIALLNLAFKHAVIGRRNFTERSPLGRRQLIHLLVMSPIIIAVIIYFRFGFHTPTACESARCNFFRFAIGSDQDFRDYYLFVWGGILLISGMINCALQLIRFEK